MKWTYWLVYHVKFGHFPVWHVSNCILIIVTFRDFRLRTENLWCAKPRYKMSNFPAKPDIILPIANIGLTVKFVVKKISKFYRMLKILMHAKSDKLKMFDLTLLFDTFVISAGSCPSSTTTSWARPFLSLSRMPVATCAALRRSNLLHLDPHHW